MESFLKKLILYCYDKGLIPEFMIPSQFKRRLKSRGVFLNREIKWFAEGYWAIQPMPNELELNNYYENIYWDERGKAEGIDTRDLDHFYLIRNLIPERLESPMVFLNFGAGHGGISHLMYLVGHRVINVEPSGLRLQYPENWATVQSIDDVQERVDFVYGSHSLEHVHDIGKHLNKIRQILRPGGYIFWEVPNGFAETLNGKKIKGRPPHTYYFTKEYFDQLGFNKILNDSFTEGTFPYQPSRDEYGEVIRYLGKLI